MGYSPSAACTKSLVDELQGTSGGRPCSVPLDKLHKALVKWAAEHRRALLRDDFGCLVSAFRALDPAGRGFLEPTELRAALGAGALTAAELTDLIRRSDCCKADITSAASDDIDGRIYYEDFASLLADDGLELMAAKYC
ncbi:hypothetical protein WJX81_002016 [Elliptochloris bilobata]|uniref:Calmodulin n=1 Tax=Elliptochloris bilobata TaxID=381761 RepID=A0AAW1QHT7_9CHLO